MAEVEAQTSSSPDTRRSSEGRPRPASPKSGVRQTGVGSEAGQACEIHARRREVDSPRRRRRPRVGPEQSKKVQGSSEKFRAFQRSSEKFMFGAVKKFRTKIQL
eukprot:6196522-Pleurochrysis_carterae.AAC.2